MTHPIPFEALDGKVGVLGITGSGKTFTAIGLVEQLLELGRQVIVVDPTGAYHGLRTAFPIIIFGGLNGDVRISEADGEAIARVIVDRNMSAIVDVSLLLKESHGAARRFMAGFVAALKNSPARARYVVMDEADEFMPENVGGGDARLFGDLKWIVRRGRIDGWRMLMVTQRPQDIAKSVLTQCETLVIHKLTAPQDRKAIEEWVKGNAEAGQAKEVLGSLARLDTGEAWIWSPRHDLLVRAQLPANRSADTSRTPDADAEAVPLVKLEAGEIAEIRATLSLVTAPASTGKSLIGPEMAELLALRVERDEWRIERAEGQRQLDMLIEENRAIRDVAIRFAADLRRIRPAFDEIPAQGGGGPEVDEGQTEGARATIASASPPRVTAPAPAAGTATGKAGGGNASPAALPPRRVRILDAIAWGCDHFRRSSIDRDIVAWLADTSPRSSSYANDLGALRSAGLIDYPSPGTLALTANGVEIAAKPPAATTRADLWAAIAAKLSPRQVRIVDVLFDVGPVDRVTLAERAGTTSTSSSFANDLGRLRTLGLIDYPSTGVVGLGRVWQ